MPIQIDDLDVELPGTDLAAILSAANRQATEAGKVVVEVRYNGESLTGEQLASRRDAPVSGSRIQLYTTDAHALVVSTLNEAKELLARTREVQAEAAEMLQQDEPAQALGKIGTILAGWQGALQAIQQSAELSSIDLDEKTFDGRPVPELIGDLAKQLQELRDLVGANDGVGLADSLGHEWPPTTDRWCALIDELVDWVGQAFSSAD